MAAKTGLFLERARRCLMGSNAPHDLTQLLQDWCRGERDALSALGAADPRGARVVELRFFGGLSVEETAETLKVSTITVRRNWKAAKVWLLRELQRRHNHEG
jgi:hypothetical protein